MRVENCDLLVVGSGASGLAAAIAARKAGLSVIIAEKEPLFGGTSATSGGVVWMPCNHRSQALAQTLGIEDSPASARRYLMNETGNFGDAERIDTFLARGGEMLKWLEDETEAEFFAMTYPDYHMHDPDASIVRSVGSVSYSAHKMGKHLKTMKNQLPQTLFLGLAIGSSTEIKHFMRATRSLESFKFVAKRMASHFLDLIRYGRSEEIGRGRALVARLARTAFDLDIPLWLRSPARQLLVEDGRIAGATLDTPDGAVEVRAAKGVILACGGFPKDDLRRRVTYPGPAAGADHPSPVPCGNTGDGTRLAESAGGAFSTEVSNIGSWVPVSRLPGATDLNGVWPHFVDRQKPGFVTVLPNGKRFTNESANYHDFIGNLIRASAPNEAVAYLIADSRTVSRWGMGFARPFPIPHGNYVRTGYLMRESTLAGLAAKAGIDPDELEKTIRRFNDFARTGKDSDFQRGESLYDHYQGDEDHKPNPCLGPVLKAPFYAVRLHAGEIGTFAGIKTDRFGRVLSEQGAPVPGLYSVGNDQRSVFAGAYPGAGATLGPALTFGWLAARHAAGLEQ
jgi:succinate dehydrogenase/fumarate reductase flavoprotein subunit